MEDTTEYLQPPEEKEIEGITFSKFQGDEEIAQIKELNDSLLSEAYSVFTYHYFLSEVTSITWTARNEEGKMVGVCVCKRDMSGRRPLGYIGMLSVIPEYRGKGIAKGLAIRSINEMIQLKFSECFLETEIDNFAALNLYESLGFRRTEYLPRYYQNGNAAYRLMLQLENIYFPTVSSYWCLIVVLLLE